MRVRTEARRQAIMKAAREVFRDQGFERASMDAICERAGGSKATLYSYFPSKDDLFIACLREMAALEGANVEQFLNEAPDLASGLERFGLWRLRTTLTKSGLAVRRMVWSDASPETLVKVFGELDETNTTWGRLAAVLERAMARGELRKADPWTAAQHFRGLLEADLTDRAFFSLPTPVDDALMQRAAKDAVDVFMRAYAAEPKKRK
jgi:AcrR family transcriptional regulator